MLAKILQSYSYLMLLLLIWRHIQWRIKRVVELKEDPESEGIPEFGEAKTKRLGIMGAKIVLK